MLAASVIGELMKFTPVSKAGSALAQQPCMETQVFQGADAIARSAPAWAHLARCGGTPTPFQSLSMASVCAAAHARRGDKLRIVIVSRTGQPVLIFPTVVASWFGFPVVRFLGDPLIQYGDVLASPEATADDFAAAWSAAVDADVACLALFRHVRDDAKAAHYLAHAASEILVQESPLIDLNLPSALSTRDTRELARLRRRLAENGLNETQLLSGAEAKPFLREALRLKRSWLEKHGFPSTVFGDADWEKAICDLCEEKSLFTVAVLKVGGHVAAIEAAFVDATCWYGFLGAFAPEFARMGAGQVLTADCLARAHALGLAYYDQLPPSQPFKRRQATGAISVRDYAIALTPVGRLALAAAKMVPEVKAMLGTISPDLRRPLLALLGRRARSRGAERIPNG